jgi:hypothetical protein
MLFTVDYLSLSIRILVAIIYSLEVVAIIFYTYTATTA